MFTFFKAKSQRLLCWPFRKSLEICLYKMLVLTLYFMVLTVETQPLLSTGASKVNKLSTFLVVALTSAFSTRHPNYVSMLTLALSSNRCAHKCLSAAGPTTLPFLYQVLSLLGFSDGEMTHSNFALLLRSCTFYSLSDCNL